MHRCTHLDIPFAVLHRTEEERSVDERVPVVHLHGSAAEYAQHPRLMVGGQIGQDERANFVVTVITFVFHLQQKNGQFGTF